MVIDYVDARALVLVSLLVRVSTAPFKTSHSTTCQSVATRSPEALYVVCCIDLSSFQALWLLQRHVPERSGSM